MANIKYNDCICSDEMIIPYDLEKLLSERGSEHTVTVCKYCGSTSRVDDNGDCVKCGASNG